jgi:hypothetical protein
LELQLEERETGEAEDIPGMETNEPAGLVPQLAKPRRKPFPDHLPRQEMSHEPEANHACICPACGGGVGKLGEDVTGVLDYVPRTFQAHLPCAAEIYLPGVRCHYPGDVLGNAGTQRPRSACRAGSSSGL